jgi:hypothetical protein
MVLTSKHTWKRWVTAPGASSGPILFVNAGECRAEEFWYKPFTRRRTMLRSKTAVQKLAVEFGRQISALMRAQVADELEARAERVLKEISELPPIDFGRSLKVGSREKAVIVVHCPVPGCRRPGVRPKRNFCSEHAASLSDAAKTKYREAQRTGKPAARGRGSQRNGRAAANGVVSAHPAARPPRTPSNTASSAAQG